MKFNNFVYNSRERFKEWNIVKNNVKVVVKTMIHKQSIPDYHFDYSSILNQNDCLRVKFDLNRCYNTPQYCSFSFNSMPFIGINSYQLFTTKYSQNLESHYYHESNQDFEMELDDLFLEEHSKRVSRFCVELGSAFGFNNQELDMIELAGMLHDAGKVFIPDSILYKPGLLTENEWKIMKTHTSMGYDILASSKEYPHLAIYAKSHHERIDGKGYPEGLKGNEIPFIARMISVADAYEAMTSDRPYRKALSKATAIKELIKHSGTQFDKNIVDVFINKVINQ
jgi:HD-GYP domain-containing protein (c-di-GMP phosphodiesterase class II)